MARREGDGDLKESAVIDPSFTNRREFDGFRHHLEQHHGDLKHILLTHGHPDHVVGVTETLREWPDASLHLHALEEENYFTAQDLAVQLGMPMPLGHQLPDPTHELKDGDSIKIGDTIKLNVIHTPGHAPGHVAFVDANPCPEKQQGQVLISGDLLFRFSHCVCMRLRNEPQRSPILFCLFQIDGIGCQ